jgi:hypothetical protein
MIGEVSGTEPAGVRGRLYAGIGNRSGHDSDSKRKPNPNGGASHRPIVPLDSENTHETIEQTWVTVDAHELLA